MARSLISLTGPDGRIILAEPGGRAYTRLLSLGFVDNSIDNPNETDTETTSDPMDFKNRTGRRGRKSPHRVEYVKIEE